MLRTTQIYALDIEIINPTLSLQTINSYINSMIKNPLLKEVAY